MFMRNQSRVKQIPIERDGGPVRGRKPHSGFTPSDVVSCVLELKKRALGNTPGAMVAAVAHVVSECVDLNGEGAERTVYRDWKKGGAMAESLSSEELLEIIRPHILKED
jgi:hypothetical protein